MDEVFTMIDAHQHFWRLSARHGYWPPASLTPIYRDFAPADLATLLRKSGVRGTVLIQTLPNEDDTQYMLALAAQNNFIRGVVGWVALENADAPVRIAALAANPQLKGLRPMLQDIDDVHWIENPALTPAIDAMIEHRLVFDALVLPAHLPSLLRFAKRHPRLPIVIDHAAKPLIASGVIEPWLANLRELAALPQVHCKLSGLLTEAGDHPDAAALAPYVRAVLALFGPQRLLWGSDWPVLRLTGLADEYAAWLGMCRRFLADLSAENQAAIFGGNAARFYRLAPLATTSAPTAEIIQEVS